MGNSRKFVFLAAVVAFMGAVFVAPAHAQDPAVLTVEKVVATTAPAGSVFTVHVVCGFGETLTVEQDVTFDETGAPTSPNVLAPNSEDICLIQETDTAGATTVTYSCTDNTDPGNGDTPLCEEVNEQGQFVVDYDNEFRPGLEATVTVTNDDFPGGSSSTSSSTTSTTMPASTPPPTSPPARAVTQTPNFTG
jgi:hypothetical protein